MLFSQGFSVSCLFPPWFGYQVPYLRSKVQLDDLVESICNDQMADYAQAKLKTTGEPTIIRIVSPDGGMNPEFATVDIVPDEDLNKRLQFYVSVLKGKKGN